MRIQRHGVLILAAALAVAAPVVAQPTGSGRVMIRRIGPDTTRRDSIADVTLTISPDGLIRMIGELLASQAMEERMAMALRGERMDGVRAKELQSQLMSIAKRNAGLASAIRLQCAADASQQPDGYMGVNFSETEVRRLKDGPALYYFSERPTIISVEPGSPAAKAGVEAGDNIVSIGGTDVRRPIALESMLKPGTRLPVRLDRDGKPHEVTITIEKRPAGYGSPCAEYDDGVTFMKTMPQMLPRSPNPQLRATTAPGDQPASGGYNYTFISPFPTAGPRLMGGAELATLTEDWRESLGVDRGVLVVRVAKGSPASDAGLRGGDVVVGVGDAAVMEPRQLIMRVNDAGREAVTLKVIRLRKETQVVLRLGPPR